MDEYENELVLPCGRDVEDVPFTLGRCNVESAGGNDVLLGPSDAPFD